MYKQEIYKNGKIIDMNFKNTVERISNQIKNKQIPDSYPKEMVSNFDSYGLRDKLIEDMGFILISLDWIKPLAKWIGNRKCLEVMSGSGSLTFALKEQGINIMATDDYSWGGRNTAWWKIDRMWTEVENIDAVQAVNKYGKNIDILIMSWAYMDDVGYKVLKTMRETNPKCIMLYIGEGEGGCTANDDFFISMQEIEDKEFDEAVKHFKQWRGIHDYPQLVR